MATVSSNGYLEDVPLGHVRLVLILKPELFYLEIPLIAIDSLCLAPRKYLIFLASCILGVDGGLAGSQHSVPLDLDGALVDQGLYYYLTENGVCSDLSHAVDLEVIKDRSKVPTETTQTRANFCDQLIARDARCVFTGCEADESNGVHIIPYSRRSEWFRRIIDNRPNYGENVEDLTDINDVRNGLFMLGTLHDVFDLRKAVFLKTPNHCLGIADIPPRANRSFQPLGVTYPPAVRYTLQWLVNPSLPILTMAPNNLDAMFKSGSTDHPSALLLHYTYGATAVKRWGHGELLQNYNNPARPPAPTPAPMGPTRTQHDRSIAIQKRNSGQPVDQARSTNVARDQARWDEDDLMLFLWGNSRAAVERHRKKQDEATKYIEQWRGQVSSVP